VESQEVLGQLEAGSGAGGADSGDGKDEDKDTAKDSGKDDKGEEKQAPAAEDKGAQQKDEQGGDNDAQAGPAARKMMSEHNLSASDVKGSGRDGRITKEDVEKALANREERKQSSGGEAKSDAPKAAPIPAPEPGEREERRVPMTRLRKRIAERLVSAQQNAAMLTTFNEVNMKPIMDMRKNYKDAFEKAHGVRLGFMGFFTRACVEALKRFPEVNASIDDDDVVYHGYYDIGMAVSTERGLVVPVVRDADQKGLAEVESQIIDYGQKAQKGKLSIDEMTGGTFTISNGGVFGSLMSMPILNPPQTAILGMHKIQERPMAVDGEVKILPMMYLALSYDHRLIDGKQAVQFLVAVKNFIEDPARLLLDI
jgi:2-oxoglutarate dehydrogenase E2 component (dihydrolipoamide succinyltransferase)